ncbi:I78 family peptidase inhibitor [Pseudoalteromonas sp. DY56-GL79]|uniref:I78 family peptidase inhibitor n=1 Tax=Pseudoalteromonas sp. DY56-GL79 TaxID=2967131 RepID=UPI00352B303D
MKMVQDIDYSKSLQTIVDKVVRVYQSGDMLTQDHQPQRLNIELNNAQQVVRMWWG